MRKNRIRLLTVALILLSATTLWAASIPFLQGVVGGIELCPQFICGSAIFVGEFRGILGNNQVRGIIATSMKHDDLPPANGDATINTGRWELKTLTRRVGGKVLSGNIHNNNDNGTFLVTALLELDPPGSGTVNFVGELNHNTLIPTFGGFLLQ